MVEPSFQNQFSERITYIATFKGAIVIHEPINGILFSISEAEKGCEIHLQKLLDDIFYRLENVCANDFYKKEARLKLTI
ncbi:MAG: hypothetical protein ACI9YE_000823 [Psychroserpens sp.]